MLPVVGNGSGLSRQTSKLRKQPFSSQSLIFSLAGRYAAVAVIGSGKIHFGSRPSPDTSVTRKPADCMTAIE
jgi:hypothetical protein